MCTCWCPFTRMEIQGKNCQWMGGGCGTVGRVVISDTKDLQFQSSHWQYFLDVNCVKKTQIKKKEAGNGHLKNCHLTETLKDILAKIFKLLKWDHSYWLFALHTSSCFTASYLLLPSKGSFRHEVFSAVKWVRPYSTVMNFILTIAMHLSAAVHYGKCILCEWFFR